VSSFGLKIVEEALIQQTEPRQLKGIMGSLGGAMPKQKALKVESIQSTTKVPGAKRIKLIYGPYTIKGTNVSIITGQVQ
jgi:hypothetical protein